MVSLFVGAQHRCPRLGNQTLRNTRPPLALPPCPSFRACPQAGGAGRLSLSLHSCEGSACAARNLSSTDPFVALGSHELSAGKSAVFILVQAQRVCSLRRALGRTGIRSTKRQQGLIGCQRWMETQAQNQLAYRRTDATLNLSPSLESCAESLFRRAKAPATESVGHLLRSAVRLLSWARKDGRRRGTVT